jgi:ABC-type dipeptide/oligopeptide/nickel transport system ATPase component
MSEVVLSVERVSAGYGDASVLRDISISVREREIVAVVGANGAGKTTLLSTIVGLVRASAGRITFKGRDISREPPHRLPEAGLALVPEGGRLFPFMTVEENLQLGAFSPGARKTLAARLDEVMDTFPILREAPRSNGRQALRRRAADVRHRARPDEPPDAPHARRAFGRPVAADGGTRLRDRGAPRAAERPDDRARRAERHGSARLATAPTYSITARSCGRAWPTTSATTGRSRKPIWGCEPVCSPSKGSVTRSWVPGSALRVAPE